MRTDHVLWSHCGLRYVRQGECARLDFLGLVLWERVGSLWRVCAYKASA